MAEAVLTGVMDAETAVGQRAMRRITHRLIIFLALCYFISYLDRVNVGFAALTMNKDIGLSATAFGLGGGLFFLGTAEGQHDPWRDPQMSRAVCPPLPPGWVAGNAERPTRALPPGALVTFSGEVRPPSPFRELRRCRWSR